MESICFVKAKKNGELAFSEETQTHWKHKWTNVMTGQARLNCEVSASFMLWYMNSAIH